MHIEREAPSFTCGHLSTSDTQDQTRPFSKQPMIMLPLFCWVWRLLYRTAARLTQKEEQEEVCLQPYLRMPGEEKPTLDGPFNHSGLSVQINSSADSPPQNQLGPSAAWSTAPESYRHRQDGQLVMFYPRSEQKHHSLPALPETFLSLSYLAIYASNTYTITCRLLCMNPLGPPLLVLMLQFASQMSPKNPHLQRL